MKRTIIAVGCLLITGVAGVALLEAQRGLKAVRERAEVARENARTAAVIKATEERRAAAERQAMEARSRPQNEPGSNMARAVVPSPAALDDAALSLKFREREKDPKMQATRLASWRAKLLTSHGVFFRRLGLTPAQVERFQDITARRREQTRDLDDILQEASAKGSSAGETAVAVAKLKDQVKAEYEAARRELLGDAGYGALREYERSEEARTIATDLAGAAVLAGVPFSAQQAEQLTQVLANASRAYRDGGAASGLDLDWRRADEQARGILSGPQLEFIQTVAPPGYAPGRFMRNVRDALAAAAKADAERQQPAGAQPAGG